MTHSEQPQRRFRHKARRPLMVLGLTALAPLGAVATVPAAHAAPCSTLTCSRNHQPIINAIKPDLEVVRGSQMRWLVRNSGLTSSGPFTVAVTQLVVGRSQPPGDRGTRLYNVPSLPSNGTWSTHRTYPACDTVEVDVNNTVSEGDEDNNVSVRLGDCILH